MAQWKARDARAGAAPGRISFVGPDAERRIEPCYIRLQLLVPAFEAGVRIQGRLMERRAALTSMLDRLVEAIAIYSTAGVPLHCNRTLDELLAAGPEAERLCRGADRLARSLTGRWSGRRATDRNGRRVRAPSSAPTVWGCRLLGSCLPAELFSAEVVLVPVEPLRPLLPPVGVVRARFALTEREADVALLLAQGLTDGAVAERLSLSPHTARRPSERVLRKLRVHSRAAVALTLLGAAGKESRTGMPRSGPDAYPNRD